MKTFKLRSDYSQTALSLLFALAAAFLAPTTARAASYSWTNTAGGNWNVANNWNAHVVPGASDTAIIVADGNYTVTMNVPVTLAGLVLGESSGTTTQILTNNGQTLTLNGQATVSPNGQFSLVSVTLSGATTLAGTLNWQSGVLNGTGSLTVAANGVLNLAGTSTIQIEGPLTNNGTVNWLNGQVQLYNNNTATYAGAIWNQAGASWLAQNNGYSLLGNFGPAFESFHNAGLFSKTNITGTSYINLYLNNTGGTVQTQIGTIDIQNSSDLGGTFQAAGGAAIYFTAGNYFWNGTANFQGPGPVQFTGGSVTITTPMVSTFAATSMVITNVGNLDGTAFLTNCTLNDAETISGTTTWANGVLNGTGSLTVAANGVLNLVGGSTFQIEGPLTNNGTVNWLSGQVQEYNNNTASYTGAIWNQPGASWLAQNNGNSLLGNFGPAFEVFHNAGLFSKTNVSGTTYINLYLNNAAGGIVQAQIGTIDIQNSSNLAGTFQAAGGAAIYFVSGNYFWNGTANFQGPGPVQITGGSVTITTPITSSFSATSIIITNLSNLGGGAFLTNCTLNDAETISGTINWANGVLNGTGSLTVAPNGVLNLVGGSTFQIEGPLTNNGTVNWLSGQVQEYNNNTASYTGAIWNQPGASWLAQNNGNSVLGNFGSVYEVFHNAGLFSKTNVAGTTYINLYLNNAASGTVQAQIGTIDIQNSSNLAGTFQAAGGAAIYFVSGNYFWSGSAVFQGPGPVQITGGSVTITTPITSSFSATSIIITNLSNLGGGAFLTNCTLNDAETITGTITWANGVLNGTASLTVAPNGVLNLVGGSTFQVEGPLTNNGTVNWLSVQVQEYNNNTATYTGAIWNQPGASWLAQNNGNSVLGNFGPAYESFHNAGLFSKTNVTGTSYINLYLNNAAGSTVQAQVGTVDIQNSSNLAGTFQAVAGAAIYFTAGNYFWNGTANFQGPGPVQFTGGTVTVTTPLLSSFSATSIIITNLGNLGGTAYLTNCTLNDAETVAGTINWANGVLNGTGSLTVAATGVLNLVGGSTFQIEGPLTNNGTVNWLAGQVQVYNNNTATYAGAIWNQTGASWFAQNNGNSVLGNFGTGAEILHNAGLVAKLNVAGTSYISVYVNNTTGTLDSELGTLAVSGNYLLGAGGTLAVGLNNVASFGLISLAGTAPLGGTLSAHLNNGYVPSAGNSFAVLSYGSAFNNFGATNLPSAATWQTTQGATTFTIQVLTVAPQVSLSIARAGNTVNVTWPNTTGFSLQQNTNLAVKADWTTSGFPITTNGANCSIAVTPPVGDLYFRLFHP